MKRNSLLFAALLVALAMGLSAGLLQGGAHAGNQPAKHRPTVTTDTSPMPTDPNPKATTTTPTPTSGTTTDVTTTAPTTTGAGTTTAPTTTEQTTTQGSGSPPPPGTTTSASPPPVVPCTTGQLTCGNNAATQIAVVTQTCNASSGPSVITVNVQSMTGTPQGTFTVAPTTACVNVVTLTQIVQQFCLGCTLIVVPPPPAPPAAPVQRALYCMPQPILRADGTFGLLVDLVVGQQLTDPLYAGAVPATYAPGVGYSCPSNAAPAAVTAAPQAPMFTLTVPASFVGQWIQLCIQAPGKTTCHAVRIDDGATVAIPVTSNISATVKSTLGATAAKTSVKPKSRKQVAKTASAFSGLVAKAKPSTKAHRRKGKK